MIPTRLRRALLGLTLLATGCGAAASGSSTAAAPALGGHGATFALPAAPPAAPVAAPPPPPIASAAPTAPPAASPALAMTFPITSLVAGGPAGMVTVVVIGGMARYHVVVSRLTPGSVHAIHDHIGACDAANRSRHLSVLGITRADAAGVISFDTSVGGAEAGAGRIVIVYATASPAVVTGCASL